MPFTADPADPATYAAPSRIGVELSRDAGSTILAALARDSYELRARGGSPNCAQANLQDRLRDAIGKALVA